MNAYENKVQNPDIREAVFQNRISLEHSMRNMLRWLIGITAIATIIAGIMTFRAYWLTQQVAVAQPNQVEEVEIAVEAVVEEEKEVVVDEVLPPLVVENESELLSSEGIVQLMVDGFYHKLSFEFLQVEKGDRSGFVFGRTSCGEVGFLYAYLTQNGYMRDVERGVWVTVVGCGMEGYAVEEKYDSEFALMYMPFESLERVHTFQDYMVAIENYAVLYQINQPALAELLGIALDKLPPNQLLPAHPYMDN